jgi:ribosomal protein S18 acetylase RimI-like enzyme
MSGGDAAASRRVLVCTHRAPASEAQLASAAALEAACFPERNGGAASALAELRRAAALQRAALLLATPPHSVRDAQEALLGYCLVTWTSVGGSVVKARACCRCSVLLAAKARRAWGKQLLHMSDALARACQLAVAPGARHSGHGAALLDAALATLRAAGVAAATLHVDAGPAGEAARRLYARAGFLPHSGDEEPQRNGGGDSSAAAAAATAAALRRDYYGPGAHALQLCAPLGRTRGEA